jgi:hypothetical protein
VRLKVDNLEVLPNVQRSRTALYVLKLRPDGTAVWLRWFEGAARYSELATDIQANIWLGGGFLDKLWLDQDVVDSMGPAHAFLLELSP